MSIKNRLWAGAVKMQPAPDGKHPFDERPVRLLTQLTHSNRNCGPGTAVFPIGTTAHVTWANGWKIGIGLRGFGIGIEGVDFEFV